LYKASGWFSFTVFYTAIITLENPMVWLIYEDISYMHDIPLNPTSLMPASMTTICTGVVIPRLLVIYAGNT